MCGYKGAGLLMLAKQSNGSSALVYWQSGASATLVGSSTTTFTSCAMDAGGSGAVILADNTTVWVVNCEPELHGQHTAPASAGRPGSPARAVMTPSSGKR
jgi:hypothetical protein